MFSQTKHFKENCRILLLLRKSISNKNQRNKLDDDVFNNRFTAVSENISKQGVVMIGALPGIVAVGLMLILVLWLSLGYIEWQVILSLLFFEACHSKCVKMQ